MKIAVCITTHNRREIFDKTYSQWQKFIPKKAKLFVVDDASDIPVDQADYRFDTNVGIAKAKNKCLELADGYDHIFVADDDCYPVVEDWWQPYIDSPEPHLMYLFQDFATGRKLGDSKLVYQDSQHKAYSHPRGCLLYFDRKVLDVVGGYDSDYARWGYEHVDLSNRIYNNNLTSFRYMDVRRSQELFYSGDEHEAVTTTVDRGERSVYLESMKYKFEESFTTKKHCPYKPSASQPRQNNVILTSYFTRHVDPQRNIKWTPNPDDLKALVESCTNQKLTVFYDELEPPTGEHVEFIRIDTQTNPYFQRWLTAYQHLRSHPEIDNVFLVDATDVTLENDPFDHIQPGHLYVGDEPYSASGKPTCLNNAWLIQQTSDPKYRDLFRNGNQHALLNCGVVGGDRQTVLELCHLMLNEFFSGWSRAGQVDMPAFNYICHTRLSNKIVYGRHVTTIFKKYEQGTNAWFSHK